MRPAFCSRAVCLTDTGYPSKLSFGYIISADLKSLDLSFRISYWDKDPSVFPNKTPFSGCCVIKPRNSRQVLSFCKQLLCESGITDYWGGSVFQLGNNAICQSALKKIVSVIGRQRNGLDQLIIYSTADRLNMNDHPLHFMLCLLDTIEPVKRFGHLDAKTVLKNIYIDIHKGTIVLYWTQLIKQQPEIYHWLDSIRSLSEWMCVNVSACEHHGEMCSIKITLQT